MLVDEEKNFGPKPFRIFDVWFEEDGLEDIVANSWNLPVPSINRKYYEFRNRFKNVKGALKEWSRNKFGGLDGEIEALKVMAHTYEEKVDNNLLNDTERHEWLECRKKWLEKEKVKTCMMKQKSRIKWILEGDENTKFFHSIINRNNIKNNLRGLYINGIWQDSPDVIKTEAFNHFSRIFKELEVERPSMEELTYPCLSANEASALELPFSEIEIKEAVFNCGSNKAPGPD
ncbi:uncharacterized protein [Rutidosis leptorrhynchoides]|uniref:uncharacterized protein n=1 Tax=Rutidosis leptorrhynchoides TaxID=125765 RepID=UPI003A9A0E6A